MALPCFSVLDTEQLLAVSIKTIINAQAGDMGCQVFCYYSIALCLSRLGIIKAARLLFFGIQRQNLQSMRWETHFLTDVASSAEDAALAIDADMRRLVTQLTSAGIAKYDFVVQVPGAFPPYWVWAALAAFNALPLREIFEPMRCTA